MVINTSTYRSKYGVYTLYQNEEWIKTAFEKGGHWEEGIVDLLRLIVDKNFTVVNVGAHVGTTLIPLASEVSRIFCFEPQTKIYDLLLKNIRQNRAFNVTAFNGVVSNSSEDRITLKGTDHFGRDILGDTDEKVNYGGVSIGTGGEEVFSYYIDKLFSDIEFQLMTIDAEGAEESVIMSSIISIEKYRPILLLEQNEYTITEDMIESLKTYTSINIEDYLTSINYYSPISLEGDNYLYIPKRENNTFKGIMFTDGYDNIWCFDDDVILDSTGDRGCFKYYCLNDNKILVDFSGGCILKGELTSEDNLLWSNNTSWRIQID